MEEFKACFNECDKAGKGLLELADFKAFMAKQNENMKKRLGQSETGDEAE
jgi:Ca2+-binding EF-hand superfamily protein